MLDAARQLFEEVGYEDATIRAIARRADVSVGSVFTSFSSKSHVLSEVMQARLAELYADLERVMPHLRGSTADRCRSLFAVHYAFEFRRLHLFLAYLAFGLRLARRPRAAADGRQPAPARHGAGLPGRRARTAATCAPTPISSWRPTC